MLIYILNYISIPLYSRIFKNKKTLVGLLTAQMFLILAFRADTVGADLDNYEKYFRVWKELTLGEMMSGLRLIGRTDVPYGHESGYVLLNWIVGKTGVSFHSFLILCAAICMISIGKYIYKYSKDPAMSYALFVALIGYEIFFGLLRQSLGLAVYLCSLSAIKERKFWKYLVWVTFASLFHSVFWITVPLYFLEGFKVKQRHFMLSLGTACIIVGMFPLVFSLVVQPILSLLNKRHVLCDFTWNNMFLLIVILGIFVFLFYKQSIVECNNIAYWGMLLAIPVHAMSFYVPVFSRISIGILFSFLYIVYANTIYGLRDRQWANLFKIISYVLLLCFYIYNFKVAENIPYVPVFHK